MNLPSTKPVDHQQPFVIGDTRLQRMNDPAVAIAISINVDIRNGERSLGHNVPLHELPLMRRLYEGLGGTVKPRPDWVPAIKRRSKLSHLQLQDELSRLSRAYVIPTEGGKRDIMAEVYGATGADRLRSLRDKMQQARELWGKVEDKAMTAVRASGKQYHPLEAESVMAEHITEKDILAIVRQLDPMDVTAESIELDPIEDEDALEPKPIGRIPAPAGGIQKDVERVATPEGAVDTAANDDDETLSIGDLGAGEDAPTELNDVDLLIADLRHAGLADGLANQAALIITSHGGDERGEQLRARGFKGKSLTAALKCGKAFDAATGAASPA